MSENAFEARIMRGEEKTYGIVSLDEWIVHSNNLNVWVLNAESSPS